jgi:hypothetical protein
LNSSILVLIDSENIFGLTKLVGTPARVTLADLLNPIKLFPNSYQTLTVPVYNTVGGPANSKIYYPIYVNDGLNSQLASPTARQLGGTTATGIGAGQ